MKTPRIPYDAPPGIVGFLGRSYPIVVPLVSLALGTELGALLAHDDPILGHPLVPYVFAPWRGWTWFVTDARSVAHSQALFVASRGFMYTVLVACLATFTQMTVDFAYGRNWGPVLNVFFLIFTEICDVKSVLGGYPPSFTWWGAGGLAERHAAGRTRKK